jgi:GH24 family phage-related lysozyme (muramidase)
MNEQLKFDQDAINFTKLDECRKLGSYQDGAEWKIGYNSSGPDIVPDMQFDIEKAKARLDHDIRHAEATIRLLVQIDLNQAQFDKLMDMCLNMGHHDFCAHSITSLINAGLRQDANVIYANWIKNGIRKMNGLITQKLQNQPLFEVKNNESNTKMVETVKADSSESVNQEAASE